MNSSDSSHKLHHPLVYLIFGAVFLLAYFLIASELEFFVDGDLAYVHVDIGRVPWDGLEQSYMRYIPYRQMSSMFWKLFLLLPGTICMALFFSLKGARPFQPEIIKQERNLPWYLFIAALLAIIIFVNVIFRQTHITDDELVYQLQAQLLSKGMLYADPPPVSHSFDNWFVITEGKYTGKYTLGHPLILALGMIFGSPYVLTIILSAALILILYRLTLVMYNDKYMALISGFLLLISPFFLFTSSTLLSHSTSAFMLGVFMLIFISLQQKQNSGLQTLVLSAIAGFCLGYAGNIRPLTALGFAFPFGIILMVDIIRKKQYALLTFVGIIIGVLPVLIATLWYNKVITGSWTEFPFHYYNPGERLGFGRMLHDDHYIHTPLKAIVNLAVSAARMNAFLLGFPVSLLFIFVLLFTKPLSYADRLCLAIIGSFCFFYIYYHSPGVSDSGPVYYYELIIPLIILSSRGIVLLHRFIQIKAPFLQEFVSHLLIISIALSFMTFYPERIIHILNLTDRVRAPFETVEQADVHNAVVFIHSQPLAGWVFGFPCNSPAFDDDVIYCNMLSPEKNREVVKAFPDRDYYILYYDPTDGVPKIAKTTPEHLGKVD